MRDVKLIVVLGVLAAGIIALLIIATVGAGYFAFQEPAPASSTAVQGNAPPDGTVRPASPEEGFFMSDVSSDQTTAHTR